VKISIEPTPTGDYLIRLRSDDSDAFHAAIRGLKDMIDPSSRLWQPASKSWRILPDGQLFIKDWLTLCKETFGAEVSWTSAKKDDRRWNVPKSKPEVDPFATLHLLPSAPPEVVKAAYKALAMKHHPDRGGSVEEMQRVNVAYETITRRLAA
jgi:hypothetical protein